MPRLNFANPFARTPISATIAAAAVVCVSSAQVFAQTGASEPGAGGGAARGMGGGGIGLSPRLVAGPGMAVLISDPAVAELALGAGKADKRKVTISTIVDVPPTLPGGGKADPNWVWLAGLPGPMTWRESSEKTPPRNAFEVRWTEPITKIEFDTMRALGADGKGLASGGDFAPSVWLDAVAPGWEVLSRAALQIIFEVPQEKRDGLAEALRTPLATPGDHWRAALLLRAIKPSTPAKAGFDIPALNAVARQQGDMWAGAIGRLARTDPGAALRVARRLLLVAYLPSSDPGAGGGAGAWQVLWAEADPQALEALLLASPSAVTGPAVAFIATQPDAIAWVRDDAGLRDPMAGASISTIGVVSLIEQTTVGSLTLSTVQGASRVGAGAGEPVVLRPLVGQLLSGSAQQTRSVAVSATVKAGAAALTLPVGAAPVGAQPPGVLVGPFYRDWTLASFRKQQPVAGGGVAGSLVMTGGGANGAGEWTLYLECRTGAVDVDAERLRVWIGPLGTPVESIEIAPSGGVVQRAGAGDGGRAVVAVSRIPGGWCATVKLPATAIDAAGAVRLSVEHIDAAGMRSTWPRPQLPWQSEPGRLAIDTAVWDREIKP